MVTIKLTLLLGIIAGVFARQFVVKRSGNFYFNIDAIKERTGDSRPVALNLYRRAGGFFLRADSKTAKSQVGRRQFDPSRPLQNSSVK